MFNQFTGIGNLASDPESKFTASGTQVVNFTVCCESGYGEHKRTEFVRCVAWTKLAAIIADYFKKGNRCMIQGAMETRSWDDKDGNKRYTTEIRVETAKNLTPRDSQREEQRDAPGDPGPGGTGEDSVPF
jgi:single-strand DNA-binding protein